MPFRPKSNHSLRDGDRLRHILVNWRKRFLSPKRRRTQLTLFSMLAFSLFSIYVFAYWLYGVKSHVETLPAKHGHYKHSVNSVVPFICPSTKHLDELKERGVPFLFTRRIDEHGNSRYVIKEDDVPLSAKEKNELKDPYLIAKRDFLDSGKLVYRKKTDHPEIVIVTLIDFDSYDKDTVIKIIQNRVNYATQHKYGTYIRWAQEFIPLVERQSVQESYEFMKPLIIRAAFFAFPYAKYFWFIDQNGLIVKMDFSLDQFLVPKILNQFILRGTSIVKGSNIKSYAELPANRVKIIIPQTKDMELVTDSFIVAPGLYGKAFLDYLSDPLVRNSQWDSMASSIGHMLQWHPKMLARTALVHSKVIAARYNYDREPEKKGDLYWYSMEDPVILFHGCRERGSCVSDINSFVQK
ncbi:alpha-1,6-mannosyltransferase Ecym_8123 [Eremothecium cymbalariae DBVPG|uniref:Uncharacterized protein n=1 Tax=Eremothecium cymbalariae (strain CBS 270.75 / DBVPG 7215 / KCTC 17166 / NRRL Y-17582) TaxID=931890 RepID=G8JX40_ERECY|nr:Hypothetical protein Ecym_8123 [Eremothecium cymbalariae DBVPG\